MAGSPSPCPDNHQLLEDLNNNDSLLCAADEWHDECKCTATTKGCSCEHMDDVHVVPGLADSSTAGHMVIDRLSDVFRKRIHEEVDQYIYYVTTMTNAEMDSVEMREVSVGRGTVNGDNEPEKLKRIDVEQKLKLVIRLFSLTSSVTRQILQKLQCE